MSDKYSFVAAANIKKEENIFEPVKKLLENVSIEVRRNSNDTENSLQEDLPVKIEPQTEVLATKQAELTALEIEQEKKRKALEEAKKLLGHSNSIEIVSIKRGRKPIEEPLKIPLHEPIVSNVNALILNDESNDELSEPPSLTLPIFEELANKNGTGVRRKIGKGDYLKKWFYQFLLLYCFFCLKFQLCGVLLPSVVF